MFSVLLVLIAVRINQLALKLNPNNCKVVFLLQIFVLFLHNVADVWATMEDFTSILSRDSAWILYMEDVKEMTITSKPLKNVRKRVRITLVSQ